MELIPEFNDYIMQHHIWFIVLSAILSVIVFYGIIAFTNAMNGGGSILKGCAESIQLYFLPGRRKKRILFIQNQMGPNVCLSGWCQTDLKTEDDYIRCFQNVMGRTHSRILNKIFELSLSIVMSMVSAGVILFIIYGFSYYLKQSLIVLAILLMFAFILWALPGGDG